MGSNQLMLQLFFLLVSFLSCQLAFSSEYVECSENLVKLKSRQQELQRLRAEDQKDRYNPTNWPEILKRDRERRMRVGQIFGEGCMVSPADFEAAALIFQHGDRPEHYWQAFVFSMHGVRMGDAQQKELAAKGIDRYLVSQEIGKKQLFASQAFMPAGSECFCLRQVEHGFPDSLRIEYTGRSYVDALEWINHLNERNASSHCLAQECQEELDPTPRGSIPGVW